MDHIDKNRRWWDGRSAAYQQEHGEQLSVVDPAWGVWSRPEAELDVLGDVRDRDVLELGCGAAQWSICLARHGARAVGLDLSVEQLRHARALVEQEGVEVELVLGNAEELPFEDDRFDVVFCDHGAMTFADPLRTVPEVARVLRTGGLFAFNMGTPFVDVCWDEAEDRPVEQLVESYYGLRRYEDEEAVGFQLGYGDWIRLFRANGFEILDLIELQPPEGATTTYRRFVPLAWARRWPAEHIWKLRRR